jgi:DNA invertase Pin-like site-specific DNA recombinase
MPENALTVTAMARHEFADPRTPSASVRPIVVWFIGQLGEIFGPLCQIVVGVCYGEQPAFRRIVTHANGPFACASGACLDPALQLDALAVAGCAKVFEDRASGARADRPGLQKALDYARDGDVLIVWKLDRLGRSLPHLIETVTALEKRGVGFRSITEAIDTTTPGGRLVFHLFGALGQFERDLIGERSRAGLVAAAARGRKGGRKPVVTGEKLERARVIIGKGLTVREAATRLRVGKTALYEALRG